MKLEKKRLTEIDKKLIIQLCNHHQVKKHMPLSKDEFDEQEYKKFLITKEKIWTDYGYGPWAYLIDGEFVGWGGLQPENNDVEVALVLHPNYWGYGPVIFKDIIHDAFETLKLKSVIILFPPTRNRIKGIFKIGFKKEAEVDIDGKQFVRFRLNASDIKF